MSRPAQACIDLQALQHNFSRVKQTADNSRVMAVIKANAYGHGLLPVARALSEADAFGVACIEEAIELREAGFDQRIVLLEGIFSADDVGLVSGYRLDMVLHHNSQLELLEQCRLTRPVDAWIKLDTGMHRLGFSPDSVAAVCERLGAIPEINTLRFMTHFACADQVDNSYTRQQAERFEQALGSVEGERTQANSAAILGWPETRADWVRPGIMLYGSSPLQGKSADDLDLRPVMTLSTQLIAVNDCRKGDAIGYGGDWVCPQDMKIGVAAIGYGDGYPRHAVAGTPVLVNGKRASLAGRVSMDMICIDLSAQPGAVVGDEVVLWGKGLPVDEIADSAGTIAYELLCGVSRRVHFLYD